MLQKVKNTIKNKEKTIVRNDISSIRKQRAGGNSIINQSDINVKEIVKEMISQVGEKWVCKNCGRETRTKSSIELHAEIHIDGLSFNCDKCGMEFRSRNALATHRSRSH